MNDVIIVRIPGWNLVKYWDNTKASWTSKWFKQK